MQNELFPQALKSDEEKATVEAGGKVKKVEARLGNLKKVDSLEVGGCSKNTLQGWLQVTGELLTVKDIRKGSRKSML